MPRRTCPWTLSLAILQFDGFRNVRFQVTAIQLTETIEDDSDSDGILDTTDNCISAANPDQTDTDLDGQGDACDLDNDNDGIPDIQRQLQVHAQPDTVRRGPGMRAVTSATPTPTATASCGTADNCPLVPNTDQTDTDQDSKGDDCDTDDDNDAVCDINAPAAGCAAGPDNCPTIWNTDQQDLEGDSIGDACDADLDGDGVENAGDNCWSMPMSTKTTLTLTARAMPATPTTTTTTSPMTETIAPTSPTRTSSTSTTTGDACDSDTDGDGVPTTSDNCPTTPNSDQVNLDGDSSGDACDADVDGDSVANGSDRCELTPAGALIDPQNGCSLAQLCPCAGPAGTTVPWKNHGKYVACVAHVANDFAAAGLISRQTRTQLSRLPGNRRAASNILDDLNSKASPISKRP